MSAPATPAPPAVRDDGEFERLWLDETSWVDVARGWISDADRLFDTVVDTVPWRQNRIYRYDHWVDEPRLGSMWSVGRPPPDPVIVEAHRALQHRYQVRFDGCALAYYRDGDDGQAFHRDRSMRWLDDTVIGVLTLGARRPWLLRPRTHRDRHDLEDKGATHDLAPAGGDLLVMGGRCQADWEHSVPQQRGRRLGGRISLQWRWTSRTGRPQVGGNYSDPRVYSDRKRG
jgi:alkylated DNA repair dioxygenase AlkB